MRSRHSWSRWRAAWSVRWECAHVSQHVRVGFAPLLAVAIGAAVAVGAVALARSIVSPRPVPSAMLARAWEQLVDVPTVRSSGTMSFTFVSARSSEPVTLTATLERARARDAADRTQAETSSTVTVTSARGSVRGSGAIRTTDAHQYLRVDDLAVVAADASAEGLQRAMTAALAFVGGRWLAFDSGSITAVSAAFNRAPLVLPEDRTSAAIEHEVRQFARTHPFIVLEADRGTERMDRTRTDRLRIRLAPDAIRGALALLVPSDRMAQREEILAAFDDQIGPVLAAAEGDVWIARRGGTFARVELRFLERTANGTPASVHGTADIRWRDWGVPIVIAQPQDALAVADLLQPFLAGALRNGLPSVRRTGGIAPSAAPHPSSLPAASSPEAPRAATSGMFPGGGDGDADGLTDVQEAFYGSDPTRGDTDGDGYRDGDEVTNGYSPTSTGRLFTSPFAR